MLPDYPALKGELQELLDRFLQQRVAFHQGVAGRFGRQRVFEGDTTFLRRSASDTETNHFKNFSGSRTLAAERIASMTLMDVLQELDALAAEMGAQSAKHFFESLDKTLEAAGQVDDAKGAKISPELILRMLERIEMNFDDAGQNHLTVVIPPDMMGAFDAASRELDEDPVMREKHRELIERKREAWRVREASRRLVG
jgi:hypothetical protein